jgi:hypothetical protein
MNWSVRHIMRVLAAMLLTGAFPLANAADTQVVVVRDGRNLVVADSATLAAKVIALAESCSVNSTSYAASKEAWASAATFRSHVRVVFPEPRKVWLVRASDGLRSEQPIREIRLPLPHGDWPAHVLVGNGNGVLSLTKYDPFVLRELVLLPELELATLAPYKSLLLLERRK